MLFYLNNLISSQLLSKKDNFGKQNALKYLGFILEQTWLGYGVTRKGNLSHYYFHLAGLLRGQNQPVDHVTAAALLKYGQNCDLFAILVRFWEIDRITAFFLLSSQILSYINIININTILL